MGGNIMNLIIILFIIITLVTIGVVIFLTIRKKIKSYNENIIELERKKNLIISGNILSELNKVESLINNKELEEKYNEWKAKFKEIKDKDVVNITDRLINVEDYLVNHKYKEVDTMLTEIEYDIHMARAKSQELLNDIEEITLSEERNREIVTKLKTDYRQIYIQYNNSNKSDYALILNTLELQFENVDKLFAAFEIAM